MFANKTKRFQARKYESELERWGKLNDEEVPKVTPHLQEHLKVMSIYFTYCFGVWIHKGMELLLLSLEL